MSESDEQAALIKWFELKYKDLSHLLIASQSGAIIGGKNKFGAIVALKKCGWKKGVPDLFLAYPKNGYAGLWIEMKDVRKTEGSLSAEQKNYLIALIVVGYRAEWCAGFDAAKVVIEDYLDA